MVAVGDRPEVVRLDLEGMTCASCAARIEKRLNKLEGVEATVNFATEQATVHAAGVGVDELVAAVEAAGYGARPAPAAHERDHGDEPLRLVTRRLLRRVRSERARRAARDGAGAPVLRVGVGRTGSHHARRPVLRARLPPRRSVERAPRGRDDGHPHLARHARRLRVVGGRARRGARDGRVLRGGRRRHDADPARPLPRGTRQATIVGGDHEAPRARGQRGARAPRRRGGSSARGRAAGRRCLRRPPRREGGDRRGGRGRRIGGRPVAPDGRVGAGRGVHRQHGCRRGRQHLREAGRSRDPRRRGHRARPDRPPRRGCPVGQGAGAAARGPGVGGLRAGGHRPRIADARRLARRRGVCCSRLHGCRGGADHRLPLCARARDADGADGRNGPRRPDGNPDQGTRRSSSRRGAWTRSCSTRPAPSPKGRWS